MRQALIYNQDQLAGLLTEDENGYTFQYDTAYIKSNDAEPTSLTLPISEKVYTSLILFPFFDGLIPEDCLLDIAEKSWKINRRDRMSSHMFTNHTYRSASKIVSRYIIVPQPTATLYYRWFMGTLYSQTANGTI